MGTSGVVRKSLRDYLVPAEELEFAEYVFRVKAFNPLPPGTKRKDHKDKWISGNHREDLWTIVNALVNTCGGVIEILTVSGDPVKDLDLDHLQAILSTQSKDVYKEYLTVCNKTGRSLLAVRKANIFITAKSNMFTRGLAETLEVSSFDEISRIVNFQPEGETIKKSSLSNQILVINGECTLAEVKEIEFKQINCTSVAQLVERIKDKRFEKVLFAMPNLPRGGDVIVGIDEDEATNKYIFRGVELDENDKQFILVELSGFMKVSSDGLVRFWGKLNHTDIKEGVHWFCHFIPLTTAKHQCDGPPCSTCPHKGRKYLIHLKFPHIPGGVFLRTPEAFVLSEDGTIEEIKFPEWLKRHEILQQVITRHTDYHPKVASLALPAPLVAKSATPKVSVQKKKFISCQDNVTIKFSAHSSHKKGEVFDHLQLPEIQHPEKFDLFKMSTPTNYTPPRNEIESLLPNKTVLQTN